MGKLQAWFRENFRNDDIVSPLTGHEVEPPFFDPVRKRNTEIATAAGYFIFITGGLILSILFPPQPIQDLAREMPDLVFFMQEGPGGGGGGSGEAEAEPPSLLQIQGEDQANIAMAVEVPEDELVYDDPDKPNEIEEEDEEPVEEEEDEIPEVIAPVVAQAPDDINQLGDIEAAEGLPESTGSGTGTGVGAGEGSGIGPGTGGGFGGGAYRPGSGVTTPIVVRQVTPQFTNDALARKITGEVVVEVIILKDGTVRPVRVVEGLSPDLNTRALEAAAQWKFIPGKFQGQPVDVIVDIVINFNIL